MSLQHFATFSRINVCKSNHRRIETRINVIFNKQQSGISLSKKPCLDSIKNHYLGILDLKRLKLNFFDEQ